MWTGSSGAYRAPHPTQTSGDAHHTMWNNQDTRPSAYMWDRDDVSSRLPHHPNPSSAANAGLEANQQHSRQQDLSNSADGIPDAPRTFPELESMSLRDLRVLDEERARFDDFVSKHQYQQQLDSIVSRERSNVEAFEREHLAITARMDEAVDEQALAKLRENVANLEAEVSALQKQKDEWMEQNSPERLMERLRIAINESETKSEALEKSMLSSSMHFDDFLSQYIACRQKYHERIWKLEQLQMEVKKKSFGR
ncbi:modifier of rudimentary (Mod(r)) protein [Gracilaria domingensis]|nr:modifier of rudimentary (Mod(r)) protein [Gracilaria domingensis]